MQANSYYAWIVEGLALFETLAEHSAQAIEVFPTASWTRWHGKRGTAWRTAALMLIMCAPPITPTVFRYSHQSTLTSTAWRCPAASCRRACSRYHDAGVAARDGTATAGWNVTRPAWLSAPSLLLPPLAFRKDLP